MKLTRSTTRMTLALTFSLVAATVGLQSAALATPSEVPAATKIVKKLLWSEEFNNKTKTGPSNKIWTNDIGNGDYGWGNQEKEFYLAKNARTDALGHLVITASRLPDCAPSDTYPMCEGNPWSCWMATPCEFTSSRINTYRKVGFKYGRMEARIQMPAGDGTWPAFWMLGANMASKQWPLCGEIDIVEAVGSDPYGYRGTAHGPGYSGGDGLTLPKESSKDLSAGYHTYAIQWSKNKLQWFMDDKLYFTLTPRNLPSGSAWVFNQEFFLVLNLAMGGTFTTGIDPGLNSAKLKVDWIRYYSVTGLGGQVIKH